MAGWLATGLLWASRNCRRGRGWPNVVAAAVREDESDKCHVPPRAEHREHLKSNL
jgi:hypothetical protein